MARKVDKLFTEYEKALGHEKKDVNDHGSENHEDGREEPPPSLSSDGSHYSHRNSMQTSKKPFFNLDVKFDPLMYNGESNAKKINN